MRLWEIAHGMLNIDARIRVIREHEAVFLEEKEEVRKRNTKSVRFL